MNVRCQHIPGEREYTGAELRPHFLLSELGLKGSALAAFTGPCRVETAEMVDWEDRLAEDRIEARSMVHFIGEFFGITLREGVMIQRLLIARMAQSLNLRLAASGKDGAVVREGDDLYYLWDVTQPPRGGTPPKLSVSIATASPVSRLLHVGVNVDPAGAPVRAIGLKELGVDPESWISEVLEGFEAEISGVEWACAKVRPVM